MRKVLFILLTLAVPVLLLAAEPVREWKNKSGKTIIQASLDNTKANDDPEQVYLLREGERYKYPFEKLSAADQEYVIKIRQGKRSIGAGAGQNGESRSMQVVPQSRRFALLIGVNEYPNEVKLLKRLPSAVKDMTDLAAALEKYAGFPRENITLMTDNSSKELLPTRSNIQEQIAKLRNKLKQNDLLIVAFSGHGVTIEYSDDSEAQPYFCVRDTDLPNIETLLSRNWFFEQIDKCKADRKIFFCDACRVLYTTNELVQLASRAGQSASIRSLQDPSDTWGYNYVLMSSCAKGQISIDTGTNGLFTKYLLEGLSTGLAALQDGDLTAFSWFEYAAKKTEINSEQIIKENPALVIGVGKQTQQTPRIECRGEMSRFVIAKLDRTGLEVVIPQNVEDVEVREYQVGELKIKLQSSGSALSGEKIHAGKIQLPPIPKKIRELTGEVQGMKDALTRMENGTHEALREAQQAKAAAQAQYEAIKARRDAEWKILPPEVQYNLERQIKESLTSEPTSFKSLRPKNIGFSQFIKQVLWGQKTELARLEQLRVEDALKVEIQKEINRIKAALADKTGELDLETRKFRQSVVQFLLEQTPGWKKPNEDEKMDYMFLSETIPALLKYPFGWDDEKLFSIAEALWKERRPCVKERIKEERERPERERIAREETARAEAQKQNFSIPGTNAGARRIVFVNGIAFAFRWCPAGMFMMGSPTSEEGRDDDEAQHHVTLTKGFWMMETEVTVGMFKAFVSDTGYVSTGNTPYGYVNGSWKQDSQFSWHNPGFSQTDNHPVTNVSWDDAVAFCKWLSNKTEQDITLPTEAQWEYACRAGTTGAYAGNLDEMALYNRNRGTHPVGTKKANAWGLFDMHGNVWEWCQDWKADYPIGSVMDPTGPSDGSYRVSRGGSWFNDDRPCRSAYRACDSPKLRNYGLGFRCVIVIKSQNYIKTDQNIRLNSNSQNNMSAKTDSVTNNSKLYAGKRDVKVINGVEFAFRYCPAGKFKMGSTDGYNSDEQLHQVTLTKGFWIMETEVTQKQWKAIMGNNPSYFKGNNLPVECISWNDCQNFCINCSKLGLPLQLPTEAQWEYACRAGTTGELAGDLNEMAWYSANSNSETHPVGTKKPNAWGLYDMHGNVQEWCADRKADYPSGRVTDPTGPSVGKNRVSRGGSWYRLPVYCRSSFRFYDDANHQLNTLGFRCVIKAKNEIQSNDQSLEKDYNQNEGADLIMPSEENDSGEEDMDDPFAFLENIFRSQQHPGSRAGFAFFS